MCSILKEEGRAHILIVTEGCRETLFVSPQNQVCTEGVICNFVKYINMLVEGHHLGLKMERPRDEGTGVAISIFLILPVIGLS